MSTIISKLNAQKSFDELRAALEHAGCDICAARTLDDLKKVIDDQVVAGAEVVVSGSLIQGPGMKITQIDKSGYRLQATGEAPVTCDIDGTHPTGTPVQKVLFDIVNSMIPKTLQDAIQAPSINNVMLLKSHADGIDYYQNKAFGREGAGRKSGLQPNTWYLRLDLHSQVEPLYVSLLPLTEDIKASIKDDILHELGKTPEQPKEEPKCSCIDEILK